MRVLVCGGRDFGDRPTLEAILDVHCAKASVIIHGACPTGADAMADDWARAREVTVQAYLADWKKHGKAAGPIRNQLMIDEGQPDLAIAFFPGGRGTRDMVRRMIAKRTNWFAVNAPDDLMSQLYRDAQP